MNNGALIVQSDRTILLEVDHENAEAARRAIAPFAELERAPEHVHTYRVTPLGLWNARAAGLDAETVVDALITHSRFPVPQPLLLDVAETMDRYGRLVLEKDGDQLVLHSTDKPVLEEVLRHKKIKPLSAIASTTSPSPSTQVSVARSSRSSSRSAGRPRTVRVSSTARPIPSTSTPTAGSCAPTSVRPSTGSGTAAAASSSCPVAPARRSSAPVPWRRPRRRPSSS